jgi:L-rhamnose mutarotase
MKREAFKMYLKPGCETEYKKRHAEIWTELKQMLSDNGVYDYSIFWDKETNILFACQKVTGEGGSQDMGNNPIVQKWWAYMADIMDTNPDNSPISIPLQEVFYMD